MKSTKIVATIGPASDSVTMLTNMIRAGMNAARLNFSHGDYDSFYTIIKNIKKVSKKLRRPVAIIQDLQGPKIRIGMLPAGGIKLKKGQQVTLTTKQIKNERSKNLSQKKQISIPVQYSNLTDDVRINDHILLHDGLVELKVIKKQQQKILCQVIQEGFIESHYGLHVPTGTLTASPLTAKDLKDLTFGLSKEVDFIALSFVRNANDIKKLKKIITKHKSKAKVIAKIERHEAIENLEEILKETDAVMVARGDLGVDMPLEQVPLLQKKIIYLANQYGKPVITATEMLQSMIESPRPTRAEVSDVANAVLDNTDAVMLSNESAVGKHPLKAVKILANVAETIEKAVTLKMPWLAHFHPTQRSVLCQKICSQSIVAMEHLKSSSLIIIANDISDVTTITKHRPLLPIIVLTSKSELERQLQLVWGVKKIIVTASNNLQSKHKVHTLLRKKKILSDKNQKTFLGKNLIIIH